MGIYNDISRRLEDNPLVREFVNQHPTDDVAVKIAVASYHKPMDATVFIMSGEDILELGLAAVIYMDTPTVMASMIPGLVHKAVKNMQPAAVSLYREQMYLKTIEDGIEAFDAEAM